jgi:hypothetical protein
MSVSAKIKTKEKIEVLDVCKSLANKGHQIVVKNEKPTAKIYTSQRGIREVEISIEKDGYEIRLTWLASFYDHLLFRDTIHIIHELTGGKLYHEYFEGEISNIHNVLSDSYITKYVDDEYDTLRILLKDGQQYEIFCPYRTFIIGNRISEQLLSIPDLREFRERLQAMIRVSQYLDINASNTPLFSVENKNGETRTLTFYNNEKPNRFILKADLLALYASEDHLITIPHTMIEKIMPRDWLKIDESQYYAPILDEVKWKELLQKAENVRVE